MGLRIGLVLALMGCAPEEEEEREVSQAAYPSEYAEALCRIQMQCSDADISMTECQELAPNTRLGQFLTFRHGYIGIGTLHLDAT